ncbi:MAG: hypothetical protein H7326_01840 [Bdellovibrionaceae bacterium]|nr:hypothetical protein [Pseudobdellovibrionaceae bacterium]
MKLVMGLLILFSAILAQAACPKDEASFVADAPALLVKFAFIETSGKTSDFTKELGKAATGGAATIKVGDENLVFARADYKAESVSGVMKCDKAKNKVIFLSVGWDAGLNGSGVKGVGIQ